MGFKSDQDYFSGTYRPSLNNDEHPLPPPLPPRVDPNSQTSFADPPPYTENGPVFYSQPLTHSWSAQDPRSSSTQSLVPEHSSTKDKRRLLLVYIHGFMGNETSFQSFPAHIHNLVTVKLAETHQVHTKIYPKYKSRKAIENARDDFSNWLRPHESPRTDIILLGHSMGGLLSAEVALLGQSSSGGETCFRHRIVGTMSFDTPFLGIHPGVIGSGIGSLFRPAADTSDAAGTMKQNDDLIQVSKPLPTGNGMLPVVQDQAASIRNLDSVNGQTTLLPIESNSTDGQPVSPFLSPSNDPNYNPPFPNDTRLASRKGWENALHFVNKHSDGLMRATRSYVTSYFEFGGCLADYSGLKTRYSRLRSLEENEDRGSNRQKRIRFVNYYTASTGRPKKQKSRPASPDGAGARLVQHPNTDVEVQALEQEFHSASLPAPGTISRSTGLHMPAKEHEGDEPNVEITPVDPEDALPASSRQGGSGSNAASELMYAVEPAPMPDETDTEVLSDSALSVIGQENSALQRASSPSSHSETDSLPPIPPQPPAPAAFDPNLYPERDALKLAKKAHSRQLKAYQRAVKDRDNAIKDRRKILKKREKAAQQQLKREGKQIAKPKTKKKAKSRQETQSAESLQSNSAVEGDETKPDKPKRDKKFCMLPSKTNGAVDPCWVRVYMAEVDEVGAHCGLFFVSGEQYEWLVQDVGERIKDWTLQQRLRIATSSAFLQQIGRGKAG